MQFLQPIGFYKSGRPIYPILGGSEGAPEGGQGGEAPKDEEGAQQTFTQEQVNTLLADQKRKIQSRYADYDDLKTKAAGAKTLEDRLADIESKSTQAEQRALRAEIAGEYGISTKKGKNGEPSDADLFLTGTDEATLTAQAQRVAAMASERRKQGNVAPREGGNPTPKSDDPNRQFLRDMLGKVD